MAIEPTPDYENLPDAPDRKTQTGDTLSNAMDTFSFALDPWGANIKSIGDNVYNNAQEAEQFAQNSSDYADNSAASASESEGYSQDSLSYAQESQAARDQAIAATSNLPDGTVNNGAPNKLDAWSSEKVAQVTNTSPSKPIFYADFTSQTYWGWKGFDNGFVSGPFSEFFTFSRGSTQTAVSPAGVIKTLAVDKPLLGWEGGSPKGVELYPAVENLLTWSEDFTNASWDKVNVTASHSSISSPIDAVTYERLEASSTETDNFSLSGYATSQTSRCTISIFLKPDEVENVILRFHGADVNDARIRFNLTNYEAGSNTAAINANYTLNYKIHPNGIKISISLDFGIGAVSAYLWLQDSVSIGSVASLNAGEGLYATGFSLTQTSYPAPYQKTEGSTVTTDDNDCSLNTDQFEFDGSGDWTVSGEFVPVQVGASTRRFSISDGTTANRIEMYGSTYYSIFSNSNSTGNVFTVSNILIQEGVAEKFALRSSGGVLQLFMGGALVATVAASFSDFSATKISLSESFDGSLKTANIFKSLKIEQKALTDAECEVATS